MKLRIKGTQNYTEDHVDTIIEEYECQIKETEEKLMIQYEKGIIEIEEQRIVIIKDDRVMQIEVGVQTQLIYDTEYGEIVMQVKGVELMNDLRQRIGKAKYEIGMLGVLPYINEVEINVYENN